MKPKSVGGPYAPDLGIQYPKKTDEHMIKVRGTPPVIDEHYPFLNKTLPFRIMSALAYFIAWTVACAVVHIRFGLKIEGREHLRKHRALLKNGALTVSNHVLYWDFICILQAVRFHRLYFPAWPGNLGGPDRNLIRLSGGIPVPETIHTLKYFIRAFDELHQKKQWLHVFPEGSWWNYHQPIRPFKKGMFSLACKYGIPVIPMAFSWRPAKGLYRLFKKKYPLVTLRIGEPVMPNTGLNHFDAAEALLATTHKKMCELAGITDNPYPCRWQG